MLTGPTEMLDQMLKNAQLWLEHADAALPLYRGDEVRVLRVAEAKQAIKEALAILHCVLNDPLPTKEVQPESEAIAPEEPVTGRACFSTWRSTVRS